MTATAMRCDSHYFFISAFGHELVCFVHGPVCVMFVVWYEHFDLGNLSCVQLCVTKKSDDLTSGTLPGMAATNQTEHWRHMTNRVTTCPTMRKLAKYGNDLTNRAAT